MLRLRFLSLGYWRRRPGRAATTVFGVALGVALMVSVGLMNDSIVRTYRSVSAALAGNASLELRGLVDAGIDARWLEAVRAQKGVAAAAPVLEQRSFLFAGTRHLPVRLRGIDPTTDAGVRPVRVVQGRGLEPGDGRGIALSEALADALAVNRGESVELLTPAGLETLHVVGTFAPIGPLDAERSRVAAVPLASLQELYLGGAARVDEIDVMAASGTSLPALRQQLGELLAGVAFVVRPRDEARRLVTVTEGLRYMLLLAGLMALVAAAYLIANNVLAAVDDRRRDLAVLRALGLSRARVRRWLLGETLVLAGVGSALGAGLGVLAAWALAGTLPADLVTPFGVPLPRPAVSVPVLLAGMAAGVGIALLAAYPVVRGAAEGRVGPALRSAVGTAGGTRAETWLQRWLLPLGLAVAALLVARLQPAFAPSQAWTLVSLALVLTLVVMTAGALPLLLSGVSASIRALPESPLWLRLAGDSLRQHRRRTGAVAASLMITLTILVGVFGMARSYRGSVAAWVDTMVGWDLMVSSGDPASRQAVSLSPALRYRLEEVPGVALASPERFASVRYGNRALPLYAYRFGEQPRLRRFASLSGASGAALAEALSGRRAVAISASLAPRLGLGVGDSLALTTPDGTLHYAIVAVVQDPGAASGSVYMDREVYVRDWSDRAVDGFALRLEPGSDPAEVARAITERFLGRYPLDVVSAAAFKEDVLRTVRATFGLSQGLIGVALLVALFGLLNAAMIGAWQLRHQLGVLRALGAPAALLSRTLMAEAWLTSLLGAGSGLVLGTLLSVALLRGMEASGAPVLAWRWPVTVYLAIAGLVALASVAAGRAPARVLRGLRHGEALHPD